MRLYDAICVFMFVVTVFGTAEATAQKAPVDLELVIAVDISGSVDPDEAALQRQGYVKAFRDPAVFKAIQGGFIGAIGVTYMEWAGNHHQRHLVKWTRITDAATAADFAAALEFEPTTVNVWTSISGAMLAGARAFEDSPFEGTRRVIDISGDGANNDGVPVLAARESVLQQRLTINGLPIVNDRPSRFGRRQVPNLDLYYTDCVIGGPGAFIIVANGFEDYARAVRRKLILEIAGVPQPPRPLPLLQPAQSQVRPPCNVGESLRKDWDDY